MEPALAGQRGSSIGWTDTARWNEACSRIRRIVWGGWPYGRATLSISSKPLMEVAHGRTRRCRFRDKFFCSTCDSCLTGQQFSSHEAMGPGRRSRAATADGRGRIAGRCLSPLRPAPESMTGRLFLTTGTGSLLTALFFDRHPTAAKPGAIFTVAWPTEYRHSTISGCSQAERDGPRAQTPAMGITFSRLRMAVLVGLCHPCRTSSRAARKIQPSR